MGDLVNAALQYARWGWRVFPAVPGRKVPLTKRGCLDATTDADQIRAWWTKHPTANVAIATGPESGLVVIDVDSRHGGAQSVEELETLLPERSVECITGGGCHLYFRHPDGVDIRNRAGVLPGIDVRAAGGYVIAPPSAHPDGGEYCWEMSSDPADVALPDLAPELAKILAYRDGPAAPVEDRIVSGKRNDTMASLAGTMRRRGFSEAGILAALVVENDARCAPPLTYAELQRIASSVARYEPDDPEIDYIDSGSEDTYLVGLTEICGESEPEIRSEDLYVVDELIPRASPALLVGLPKDGKTLLALALAVAVAGGTSWLGRKLYPGKVLVLANEDAPLVTAIRLWQIARGMGIHLPDLNDRLCVVPFAPFRFDRPQDVRKLRRTLDAWAPKLAILDSLRRFSGADENSSEAMAAVTVPWAQLCQDYDCCVLPIHHLAKRAYGSSGGTSFAGNIRGSGDLLALCRQVVGCKRTQDWQRSRPVLEVSCEGNVRGADPFVVAIEDGVDASGRKTLEINNLGDVGEVDSADVRGKVIHQLRHGPQTLNSLTASGSQFRVVGAGRPRVQAALTELVSSGDVVQLGGKFSLIRGGLDV